MSDNLFTEWLNEVIAEQGVSVAELARRIGVSPAAVSQILSGKNNPGPEFCRGLASVLALPPDGIFRRAGLLPNLPAPADDMNLNELRDVMKYLRPRERRQILEYAYMLYRLQCEEDAETH
ncbi:MAG: helix-turn-helix transcriptional regulator [Anaerolineae bacterium]|nr:helix-turn-helix transcriptional regulator [Anaerolineae bacterium]